MTQFNLGDLVRHRASGEKGVVVELSQKCTVHSWPMDCYVASPHWKRKEECRLEYTGRYLLSHGFDKRIMVDEDEIELVEAKSDKPIVHLTQETA